MKLPPFTLVHSPAGPKSRSARDKLLSTLSASRESGALKKSALERVDRELNRAAKVETAGIWDLGAWVGGLPRIVEAMNKAQPELVIFEVQAAVPAGLVSRPERIAAWAEEVLARKLRPTERAEMQSSILDVELLPIAERVRKEVGVDYLVALTAEPIAGAVDDEHDGLTVFTDLFAAADGRVSIASTAGLREFAADAGRPFEHAAAFVFLGALLASMNPKLETHDDTGCLMDFNYDRAGIVPALRKPALDQQCVDKIKPAYRDMAMKLIRVLDRYGAAA
jgi:hypothetical protein